MAATFYFKQSRLIFDTERLPVKPLLMDNLQFLLVLYFILEYFTVLKHILTLGACHVSENFTVLKQTHMEHMFRFGTCSAFVTFLRFELMILADFLLIFRENIRYFKIF